MTKEHLAPLQDVGYSHRSVVGSHLPSGRDNFRAHFNQTIPTPQQPGASVNTQEPRIASCPLKTSPWPAWLLGVIVQRRLDSQFPSSQAWPAWPWARHFTSLIACRTADAAISLQRPEYSRELPVLPSSVNASRSKKAEPGCPPAPSLPRLILKIKTSFHLSQPQERRRQKEVCCAYMKLSLSEGEKKSRGKGAGTREGTKPHFYFWWPAS